VLIIEKIIVLKLQTPMALIYKTYQNVVGMKLRSKVIYNLSACSQKV